MKFLVYSTEDRSKYGFKIAKFDFKSGTKILNKTTGKIIVVTGVVNLETSEDIANTWMHRCMKRATDSSTLFFYASKFDKVEESKIKREFDTRELATEAALERIMNKLF